MAKTRTFIAVTASRDLRAHAQKTISALSSTEVDVKWVMAENLHWTMQFLGDLDDDELVQVCRRVDRTVRPNAPFELIAHGVGAFPSLSRPRAIWLGAGEGGKALCQLQAANEKSLSDLGFLAQRRPYVPHLTLGRLGRGREYRDQMIDQLVSMEQLEGPAMMVDEVIVMASYLEHSGPTYQVLARVPLAGA
ncbi:MAG: RNA 2',3'-cyclic phosphodiesterase [Pirellulales bacterium]